MPSQIDPMKAREYLLKRVKGDFTYKSDFTKDQLACWNVVKKRFELFRDAMDDLIGKIPKTVVNLHPLASTEYTGYKYALREVERWCNTAIANEWETGDPQFKQAVKSFAYDGPSGGDQSRHRVCDKISKDCYELILELVQFLPMGRSLSVAVTRMQDVRGWLLDAVNLNWVETDTSGKASSK